MSPRTRQRPGTLTPDAALSNSDALEDSPTVTRKPLPPVDHAMATARRGWHVFPLRPASKLPALSDWEHRASTDPRRIAQWWDQHPDAGYGIACGPSGLLVVDIDDKDGRNGSGAWFELRSRLGVTSPATFTVDTPSGGRHLYLAQPAGIELRNSAGKLGDGIDTRGHGGYVVGAGSSIHGGTYTVTLGGPVAECPGWLVDLLRGPPSRPASPTAPSSAGTTPYGRAALERCCGSVAMADVGQRNHELNRQAFALGRLIAGREVDALQAVDALEVAATRAGLSVEEARRTIESGMKAGAQFPRSAPARGCRR